MSLFDNLHRYRATEGRDPLEDYLTEVWRWLLQTNPSLSRAYLVSLGLESVDSSSVTWSTHMRLADQKDAASLDLVADIAGGPLLVFEHKVWSPLSKDQLSRYRDLAERRWPDRDIRTAIVTGRSWQWTQEADWRLTWPDLHSLVHTIQQSGHGSDILAEFMQFLTENQLGPELPLLPERLLAYTKARGIEGQLAALHSEVAVRMTGEPLGRILRVLGTREPLTVPPKIYKRWGRIGFELPSEPLWRPGLFIGTLLDPEDHLVCWSRPERGPDLTLILSFMMPNQGDPGAKPDRDAFLYSPSFEALRLRLVAASEAGPYHVVDVLGDQQRKETAVNLWHPLHLRRPMIDVLDDAQSLAEQAERVVKELQGMLGVLLEGGELEFLRDTLT